MKIKKVIAVSLLPLNVLLLFFLIVSSKIMVPAWLQVPGRTHPMLLHFPIVLVLLYAAWVLCSPRSSRQQPYWNPIEDSLLLGAAVTAALTALTGFLLSREPGYDEGMLSWHKWWGAGLSFLLYGLYAFKPAVSKPMGIKMGALTGTLVLLVAAHFGGNITHGENFVWAPVTPTGEHTAPPLEEAMVFNDVIKPILDSKCMSCHNDSKAKGELILATKEAILQGGKSGHLWDTTKEDLGLLMQRLHLPETAKKHMPPVGKPQLTPMEINLLKAWVRGGSLFDKKVLELPDGDTLKTMAASLLHSAEEATYDFEPADDGKIRSLSNNNRMVSPVAVGSPALAVNFYNRAFYTTKELEALNAVGEQIVSLNLDRMPVSDADLATVARFRNLRKLSLNFTAITGSGLAQLKQLGQLKSLSLTGTPVNADQVKDLQAMERLKALYLWNTGITEAQQQTLATSAPTVHYYYGFKDTAILKIIPPVIENESLVITDPVPLKLKHYIGGSEIRYTLDGKEPDSLHSPLYSDGIVLKNTVLVKTKAYHKGWIASEVVQKQFYRSGLKVDSILLATEPEAKYKGKGAQLLIDRDKSEPNFGNGKWLGYHGRPVIATLLFRHPATVNNVTISMIKSVDEHIFPPAAIQIWGGRDSLRLKLLKTITPPAPGMKDRSKDNIAFSGDFTPTPLQCIRVVLKPIGNIVPWVKDKKAKSWLFIDEVFVN
ncbi:FN3 associated domain-containing protein [Paraflavitalea pollutisoli]|uniref:FN3 associated domain-containing protein n=1 Tax=Paraflavitalea pollutisoli TaxID=3034143 RepID=UPI0023ED39A3|nr:FN3 associated domain-containing protein [Paraflavitalea sp. H1-2-19X]